MNDHSKTNFQPYAYLLFLPPLLATAFLYRETLARLGKGLMTYENSHGLIILAISLYLVWSKRRELERQPLKPHIIAGSVITALGCALLVAGTYSFSVILSDASLIVTLFGLVWLLLGTGHMKILALPMGYLIFAYPLFDYLPPSILAQLQNTTAWLSEGILKLAGISVHRDSVYLELPNITLQIVQACAGTSHIISLLAVSVLLAHYYLEGWLKKMVLVAAALFVGLAANGIRVAVIGIISMFSRNASQHGPGDIFYVSFVFFIGLAVIIGLTYWMTGRKKTTKGNAHLDVDRGQQDGSKVMERGSGISARTRVLQRLAILMAVLIPASASAYAHFYAPRPVPLAHPLSNIPAEVGEWQAICEVRHDFIPSDINPDAALVRCYQNGKGQEVHLYVAYFTHQRQSHKVTDFTLNLYTEGEEYRILKAGDSVILRRAVPNRRGSTGNTYFWYSIDGKAISSRLEAKLALVLNGIMKHRTNGSLVSVRIVNSHESANDKRLDDGEILETFYPAIQGQMGE